MFDSINGNVKYCYTSSSITGLKPAECEDLCFNPTSKINMETNNCTYDCNGLWELGRLCYRNCPEGTHKMEREDGNLSCVDYVQKGYYVDKENQIKKCHETCESCLFGGDENNHNCTQCKFNYSFLIENITITNCYPKCKFYYYFDESEKFTH